MSSLGRTGFTTPARGPGRRRVFSEHCLRQRGETRYHSSTRLVGDDGLDGVARSAVVVAAFMAARRKAAGAGQGRESMRKGGEAARRQRRVRKASEKQGTVVVRLIGGMRVNHVMR